MRLIDADLLHYKLMSWSADSWNKSIMPYGVSDEIIDMVDNAPTVDAVSVRHGEWIKMSDVYGVYYACSECGEELTRVNSFDRQFDVFPRIESIEKTRFCPNCGADMRGKENG